MNKKIRRIMKDVLKGFKSTSYGRKDGSDEFIIVQNNGKEVISSNYWESDLARAGKYYLSTNARSFRLLLPDSLRGFVDEMKTGRTIVVTVGPWPSLGVMSPCFEILFDDGSNSPFCLHMNVESTDGILPIAEDAGMTATFSVWVRGTNGPKKVFEKECHIRFGTIPDLRPWRK